VELLQFPILVEHCDQEVHRVVVFEPVLEVLQFLEVKKYCLQFNKIVTIILYLINLPKGRENVANSVTNGHGIKDFLTRIVERKCFPISSAS